MPRYEIAVVRDAIRVLKTLASAGQAIALHEVAAKARLHKIKVFRILVTLERQGLAQREDEY
jgi:DNA-binding IclR family transcriptional regulator